MLLRGEAALGEDDLSIVKAGTNNGNSLCSNASFSSVESAPQQISVARNVDQVADAQRQTLRQWLRRKLDEGFMILFLFIFEYI